MDVKSLQTLFAVSLIAALAPIFPSIAAALARRDRPLPGTPDAVKDAVVLTEARVVGEVSLEGDAPAPDEDRTAGSEGHTAEGHAAEPE